MRWRENRSRGIIEKRKRTVVSTSILSSHLKRTLPPPEKNIQMCGMKKTSVVSIGAISAFKVVFTPMKYNPIIPPLLSYVIDVCFVLTKRLHFFSSRFYQTIDIYQTRGVMLFFSRHLWINILCAVTRRSRFVVDPLFTQKVRNKY